MLDGMHHATFAERTVWLVDLMSFLKPFKISLTDFHGESVAGIDWIM